MSETLVQSMERSAGICHPDCVRASNAQEDYDASQSAASVAVNLISSARVILKLDTEYTMYSSQFLVDNAGKEDGQGEVDPQRSAVTVENILQYLVENVWSKKEDRQGEMDQQRRDLTVKECLQFAFKEGLPRREHWAHLGCTFKAPSFAIHNIPRVPMKGEVIEATTLDEALKMLMKQPVGARLHVFSPEFDRVEEEGFYDGPSGDGTRYVGLRDVMIVAFEEFEGKPVVTVQIVYKKKISFVKVCARRMVLPLNGGDKDQMTEPTGLLVDFCVPRFSIN